MNRYAIALYPGDGIGIEVVESAVKVLHALAGKSFQIDFQQYDWGVSHYEANGVVAPAGFLETLKGFDAIFLGAVGFPARLPDHVTLRPLIEMRQAFDLYACVRPARTYPGISSLLKSDAPIDMVVVRENSEGEYIDNGGRFRVGRPGEFAVQTAIHTRRGIERILRYSFELAKKRRNRLTMITKSNAQKYGFVLWDEVLEDVRAEFPEVETDKQHIDAASMNFVRRPEAFDVVVASNLFGDILTDLSGAITGSLGLNPSANLNPERTFPSLFEPVHGSAPDIVGMGIANPIGAILSAGMMLDWLGENESGERIRTAVVSTVATGSGTPDIGGTLSTEALTDAIIERL